MFQYIAQQNIECLYSYRFYYDNAAMTVYIIHKKLNNL